MTDGEHQPLARKSVAGLPAAVCDLHVGGQHGAAPPHAAREDRAKKPAKPWIDLGIEYRHYPMVYAAKIALTVAAMIFVWPGYRSYERRQSLDAGGGGGHFGRRGLDCDCPPCSAKLWPARKSAG